MLEVIDIIKGEDKKIFVQLVNEENKVYKLNLLTEAKAIFIKDDGTKLEKTLTGGAITIVDSEPANGELMIELSDADTSLLKVANETNFELEIHESAQKTIVQFLKQLNVLKRI
jgi:hypothetical protein